MSLFSIGWKQAMKNPKRTASSFGTHGWKSSAEAHKVGKAISERHLKANTSKGKTPDNATPTPTFNF